MPYPATDTELRTSAIAALVEANTLAGDRVEDSRTATYGADEVYPRLAVSTPRSTPENESIGAMWLKRKTSLVVVGTVRVVATSGDTHGDVDAALAAALDTFEGQVLHALAPWSNVFDTVSLRDINKGRVPDSEVFLGQVALVLECTWNYTITRPEIPDSLSTIGIDVDLALPAGGPEGRVESSRLVDFTE